MGRLLLSEAGLRSQCKVHLPLNLQLVTKNRNPQKPLVHRELVMARLLFGEIGLRSICKAHLPMSSKRKQKSSKFSSKNPEFGLTPQQ